MVNLLELKKEIKISGITVVALSRMTKIPRTTLYSKLRGEREFTCGEAFLLASALHFDVDKTIYIFFYDPVPKMEAER